MLLALENGHLRLEVGEDARLRLRGRDGKTRSTGPVAIQEPGPIDIGHVWPRGERSLCEQYPGRFRASLRADGAVRVEVIGQLGEERGGFTFMPRLDGEWLRIELREVDERLPSLVFPAAFGAPGGLVLPVGVGRWQRRPLPARQFWRFFSPLNMRWFGGLDADLDHGWIGVFTRAHHDAGLMLAELDAAPTWLRSLGRWTGPREVSYRLTAGGWVGMAKAYRDWAKGVGLHVPLADKLERTPQLRNLVGGRELNLYLGQAQTEERCEDRLQPVPPDLRAAGRLIDRKLTYTEAAAVTKQARELGMRRGVAMVRGWIRGGYDESHPDVWPPETAFGTEDELRAVTSLQGEVVGGIHDNYQDIYPHCPSFPRGVIRHADGSPMRGGFWAGGQCYILNSRDGLAYARRNWERVGSLRPGKVYSDTITAVNLYESFEPGNELTRAQDERCKQDLLAFFKAQGVAVASESGADFGIPWLDTVDADHRRHVTAESATIPLWQLVFHDAVLTGRHNHTPADMGDPAVPWWTTSLLWGSYTMWGVPSPTTWQEGFRETLFVEEWMDRVGAAEMTGHRFLDAELLVERTEFAGGHAVIANFSPEPRTVDGVTVAGRSAVRV